MDEWTADRLREDVDRAQTVEDLRSVLYELIGILETERR